MKREDVKVGMKLTVRDDLEANEYYGGTRFTSDMKKLCGKTITVSEYDGYDIMEIVEDLGYYCWHFEMFKESQQQSTNSINPLIKRVLVNGKATIVFFNSGSKQVVKLRDGKQFDLEKAVAIAISKEFLGGYTEFKNVLGKVEYTKTKGVVAVVVSRGQTYDTYDEFFVEQGMERYIDRYAFGKVFGNGETVTVLHTGNHRYNSDTLSIIENELGQISIISNLGLKFL